MRKLLHSPLFADTCFIVGLFNQRDQWHEKAKDIFSDNENHRLFINDYVINETITLLNSHTDYRKALTAYDYLILNCRILWIESFELEACREIFATYGGALSFTDAAIVRCMQREGLRYLLSFDRRFDRVEGLTRVHRPGQLAPDDG